MDELCSDSLLYTIRRYLDRLVLPHANYDPSAGGELLSISRVSLNIGRDLGIPIAAVCPGPDPVLGTSVPEAAIYEDRHASSWKHNVCSAAEDQFGSGVFSEAHTSPMELRA
jgi:hypothetical protein